jgi:hypothetical protein
MNLTIKFMDNYFNFNFSDILIIAGGSASGKSRLFNHIIDGFDAKISSKFIIDGSEVNKNEYHCLNISLSNGLDEEIKFTRNTYLYSKINNIFKFMDNKSVLDSLNDFSNLLISNILEEDFKNLNVNVDLDLNNLLSLIIKNMVYKNGEVEFCNLSLSEKFEIQLKMYIKRLISINDNTILLIDDFDSFVGFKKALLILDYIKNSLIGYKTKVIVFLRNEELVNELLNLGYNIYFLKKNKTFKMTDFRELVDGYYSYCDEIFEKELKKIKSLNQKKKVYEFMN